jgi:hypothetical protein
MAQTQPDPELEAFCTTCPTVEEVTTLLEGYGFQLTFHMEAVRYAACYHMAPLPAQYHYRDTAGTEVVFLAGPDLMCHQRTCAHASRFWMYPGADPAVAARIALAIATLVTDPQVCSTL